jgi:hypothetical protein
MENFGLLSLHEQILLPGKSWCINLDFLKILCPIDIVLISASNL